MVGPDGQDILAAHFELLAVFQTLLAVRHWRPGPITDILIGDGCKWRWVLAVAIPPPRRSERICNTVCVEEKSNPVSLSRFL